MATESLSSVSCNYPIGPTGEDEVISVGTPNHVLN